MKPLPAYQYRAARVDDAAAMTRIYNETVAGGGHSPMLVDARECELEGLVKEGQRRNWPVRVLEIQTPDGPELIGWICVRGCPWAPTACVSTGDFWIYVARAWHGSGAAMRLIRHLRPELGRYGFDTLTCWILGGNRRSLAVARACRFQRWGLLPGIARYGERAHDLQIWGTRLDDPAWCAWMDRLERRYRRLEALRAAREHSDVRAAA